MALYTFYLCSEDGSAAALDARDLAGLPEAQRYAHALLREHASCTHVQVCRDDREVLEARRADASLDNPVLSLIADALNASSLAAADIAVIATNAAGTVAYWNPAAAALYGWSSDEAVGRNVLDLTPATQSRGQAARIMQSLRSGSTWQGEFVVRGRDGRPFRAFVTDIPVGDIHEGGGAIVGASVPADRRREVDLRYLEIAAEVRELLPASDLAQVAAEA